MDRMTSQDGIPLRMQWLVPVFHFPFGFHSFRYMIFISITGIAGKCTTPSFEALTDFEAATIFRTSISKVPRKKGKKSKRSFFSREELKVLFNLPSASEIGVRDKTLLCFMYASGARAQEVCDLTVG